MARGEYGRGCRAGGPACCPVDLLAQQIRAAADAWAVDVALHPQPPVAGPIEVDLRQLTQRGLTNTPGDAGPGPDHVLRRQSLVP